MRKIILTLFVLVLTTVVYAQSNAAYIYSTEILTSHPKYKQAQSEIESFAKSKQAEIDAKLEQAKSLFDIYSKSNGKLSSVEAQKLKEMVIENEKAANKLQEEIFGKDGELAQKQKSLLSPIEQEVIQVVERIAKEKGYQMVFDFSIMKNTIYQSETINLTGAVKQALGLTE